MRARANWNTRGGVAWSIRAAIKMRVVLHARDPVVPPWLCVAQFYDGGHVDRAPIDFIDSVRKPGARSYRLGMAVGSWVHTSNRIF